MGGPNVLPPGAKLTITASSQEEPEYAFGFMVNVSRITGASQLELTPGHILRKGTASEITAIKAILVEHNGRLGGRYFFPWEMERKSGGLLDEAPEEDWNYFVVAFSGSNQGMHLLEQAFALLDSNLKVGFTTIKTGSRKLVSLHAGRLFQALQENFLAIQANRIDEHLSPVDAECAVQIRRLAERLSEHVATDIDIPRVCNQLLNLQVLDANSDVAFLGYFTVLESLLVHKPDPKDPTDSITRQVKKKITLLDNRWNPKIDYSAFDAHKPEAIWGKMYEMRSAIAHGDLPDFKQSLKSLRDFVTARSLLTRTVRAIARHALEEPRLVADLREC
jgi:Apea-like HEPN